MQASLKQNAGTEVHKGKEAQGLGPQAAVDLLQKLGDYLGHYGLGSLFSCPPGSIVAKYLKDLGKREVGSETLHARKDEVAN
jgi:hypothetical protein